MEASDGVLVLENVIEVEHLDRLRELLQPTAEEIAQDDTHDSDFEKHPRIMDQALPTMLDFMFEDVWSNRIAVSILQSLAGPNLRCHYANANASLKAGGRQLVRNDFDKPHPVNSFAFIINIPLSDMDEENGSPELWPGSHRDSFIQQHVTLPNDEWGFAIKPALVEQRRNISPPVQPTVRKGSLIIRDIHLWHAGMPNRSDTPRTMLAFVIQPTWIHAPSKVTLPLETKALVDGWKVNSGLEYAVHWVDGDADHEEVDSDDVEYSTGNSKWPLLESLMRPTPESISSL
ncbi:hypothetical protein D0868_11933 [Hortaea werneckii]|uniref:Phytanoyl-CoA dioxygenase n=1 Tax=Hortaea werneckii TaxID=91943 RepID=A0A3M7AEY4_HORWE|nr:hypothetical protein D0868_11933 [Hortaea werneckii]RMY26002.1 hypothetical protein D0866_10963 [Hortaea werneckii]